MFDHDDADGPSADSDEVFHEDVLHKIAAAWTASPEAPSAHDEQRVRGRTTVDDLITVIQCVRAAHESGETALAAAYERMAVLQLETLHRRASVGNAAAAETLRAFEREIDRAIAAREIPALYRDLHRELSRRAGPATGAAGAPASPGNDDADLDKLRARIQALRSKTVERGCTEEEALAAAAKVADLLDRHGLSLSELEMRQQACEGFAIETGRRRRAPIDDSVGAVAEFCDCRYWIETNGVGELRFIFFGLPADVSGARCLYDMIVAAVAGETGLQSRRVVRRASVQPARQRRSFVPDRHGPRHRRHAARPERAANPVQSVLERSGSGADQSRHRRRRDGQAWHAFHVESGAFAPQRPQGCFSCRPRRRGNLRGQSRVG